MSYQVLARKWRPQTFTEVVGQAAVTTILTNAIAQDRMGHAFLFAGTRGVGKTTTARILAKSLNCTQRNGPDPCNQCDSCREITADNALDVLEIDGASNRGIDDIRDLRENARYAPSRDAHKIFIIDEVHQLTKEAFNALLKTLEEPPPHVVFIMATTELHKMPATILSRCQVFEFKQIAAGDIFAHLERLCREEGVAISERSLQLVTRVAAGSMRDALSTMDQVISFCGSEVKDDQVLQLLDVTDFDLLQQAAEAVRSGDAAAVFTLVHQLQDRGHDLNRFCRDLVNHMRNMLLVKLFGPEGDAGDGMLATLTTDEPQELSTTAESFSEPDLIWCIDTLLKTDQEIKWAAQPGFLLEASLVKLAQQARLVPLNELIARLDGSDPAPAAGGPSGSGAGGSGGTASGGRRPPTRPAPGKSTQPPKTSATPPPAGEKPAGTVEGLMAAIATAKPALHGMLSLAATVRCTDGELHIDFAEKDRFPRQQIEQPENMKHIKELARHQFGGEVSVTIGSVPDPAPPAEQEPSPAPAVSPPRPAAKAPDTAAEKPADPGNGEPSTVDEPLIQKALDLFGGKIVSVDPPEDDAGTEPPA